MPSSVVRDNPNGMCIAGSWEQKREDYHASAPRMQKVGLCARVWTGWRSHCLLPRPDEDNSSIFLSP